MKRRDDAARLKKMIVCVNSGIENEVIDILKSDIYKLMSEYFCFCDDGITIQTDGRRIHIECVVDAVKRTSVLR